MTLRQRDKRKNALIIRGEGKMAKGEMAKS
jgi:hypothetical protein